MKNNIFLLMSLMMIFFLSSMNIIAQEKVGSTKIYNDDKYKYQLALPANYIEKKISDDKLNLREKKDIESTVRIALNVLHFETNTATGKMYDFAQFARTHAMTLYRQGTPEKADSLLIKDYATNVGLKGKEVYVRLVNSSDKSVSGKEEQVIKGPVYVFDISSKIGIPGTALVIHQVSDDSKTSRAIRGIVDALTFGN